MRFVGSLLYFVASLLGPATISAQPETHQALPWEDVLQYVRLEDPDSALRDISRSNPCFDFDLTEQKQQELVAAVIRRNSLAPIAALDPLFAYIRQHPCRNAAPPSVQASPLEDQPLNNRDIYFGLTTDANVFSYLQGLGLQTGIRAGSTIDLLTHVRYAWNESVPILDETGSRRVGTVAISGRMWFSRGAYPFAAYFQAGGIGQLDTRESSSYTAKYGAVGITGGGGIGVFAVSRIFLSLEYQGQTVWSVKDDEEGFTHSGDGSEGTGLIRFGITVF